MHAIALVLPQTYAIDAVRRHLHATTDASPPTLGSLSAVQSEIAVLTLWAFILLMLGLGSFSLGLAKAQHDGRPSCWVQSGLNPG